MRKAPLVVLGTAAGIAGVLAFPTHKARLATSSAAPGTSTGSTSTGSTSTGSSPAATSSGSVRSATSVDETYRYGDLAVTVTVEGTKITSVKLATLDEADGRSASIDRYAIPRLERQVISADSANIDGVSGATITSQAFADAVGNALQKLGLR